MGVLKPLEEKVIIEPKDVKPSSEDMEVIGVTNPGGILFDDGDKEKVYLLLRVIEKTRERFLCLISFPRAIPGEKYKIVLGWERENKDAVITSPHSLETLGPERRRRLTTISHLRLAESEDGINFKIS